MQLREALTIKEKELKPYSTDLEGEKSVSDFLHDITLEKVREKDACATGQQSHSDDQIN